MRVFTASNSLFEIAYCGRSGSSSSIAFCTSLTRFDDKGCERKKAGIERVSGFARGAALGEADSRGAGQRRERQDDANRSHDRFLPMRRFSWGGPVCFTGSDSSGNDSNITY